MFDKMELTEYHLEDQGNVIGLVRGNYQKLRNDTFAPIFVKLNSKFHVVSIGRVNYAYLDAFIVKSMNDYYQKLNVGTEEERKRKNVLYQRLYHSWNAILQAKSYPDASLNDLYDAILYELYILGYKE